MKRNPIAKSLRSPALRVRVVAGKKKLHDRKENRAKLKQGKYDVNRDHTYPPLLRLMTFRRQLTGETHQMNLMKFERVLRNFTFATGSLLATVLFLNMFGM